MKNNPEAAEYGAHIRKTNDLQRELITRKLEGAVDQDALVMEWVDSFSKRFHEILKQKAIQDPQIWEKIKDEAFRSNPLVELEVEMYEEELKKAA